MKLSSIAGIAAATYLSGVAIAAQANEVPTIRVDAPLATLTLSVVNDDPTLGIMCGNTAFPTKTSGRITIQPRPVAWPPAGVPSDTMRDLVYVWPNGIVVAVFPGVPGNPNGGGPSVVRSAGVFAQYLIELPPFATVENNIGPGTRLYLPRHLSAPNVPNVSPPCSRNIR